jgi:hypothetical protein
VTSQIGYQTPAAFRRALTDRLKGLSQKSRWTLPQLQRQIAYDRLLERLYTVNEAWVIKGATALIARGIGVRGTIDVDIYREVSGEVAERDLRSAAALDLGDWFRFDLDAAQQMEDGKGRRDLLLRRRLGLGVIACSILGGAKQRPQAAPQHVVQGIQKVGRERT